MRILFLSHYFPPEGNAPASRVHACARRWVEQGHQVTVITCAPNVPNGVIYPGYKNRWSQRETIDGIEVVRVWTYVAANQGTIKRILNYLSFMLSAMLQGSFMRRPDVLIATSPQFFCGWAGLVLSKLKRVPFVLEIRDIWPDSILAVGAKLPAGVLRLIAWMEKRMYRSCDLLVTVGQGYFDVLRDKGVSEDKMSIIMNGVDADLFQPADPDPELLARWGLSGKFVCSYIGTIGMACGLEVVLRAARRLKAEGRPDIVFLLVGDGAQKAQLQAEAEAEHLDNIVFTGRQDKAMMPGFLAASDACLVHLKKTELFESVMPSKIFEAAGMARPIIIGVKGQATELVLEANAGLAIEPEDDKGLLLALETLMDKPEKARAMGRAGHDFIRAHFDRNPLADRYLALLESLPK
ncbi:MAG: glycosyltransferase involved in cell wall biosynthesis [Kiritimatiellia bacterium]|jgi:glycosyltransferase involved in cell wall biosynthesis